VFNFEKICITNAKLSPEKFLYSSKYTSLFLLGYSLARKRTVLVLLIVRHFTYSKEKSRFTRSQMY